MQADIILESRVQYKVLKLVGSGGSAQVYHALRYAGPEAPSQTVALKILRESLNQCSRDELFNEARVLQHLKNPSIVETLGVERMGDGRFALVLEYVDGINLEFFMRACPAEERRKFAPRIAAQVFSALQAAHRAGVVHGDVSPRNILMDKNGRIKLADFGLACALAKNNLRSPKGTRGYLSPHRQLTGSVSPEDDCFAAKVILCEFIQGYRPPVSVAGPSWPAPLAFMAAAANAEEAEWGLWEETTASDVELGHLVESIRSNSYMDCTKTMLSRTWAKGGQLTAILAVMGVCLAGFPSWTSPQAVASPKITGRVDINVRPWAHVFIDGKLKGTTPLSGLEVSEGVHHIKLSNGDRSLEFSVQVLSKSRRQIFRRL